ncbi:MAG TPA: lysoplasmalogenase, partial [Methylomirabilota bacterium]|nr:lysoplasmalogenase [Methylomirabilota bacterium]
MDLLTLGRLRHVDPLDRWLLLLSIASAVAYFATRPFQPFPGSVVVKALGMAPLALMSARVLGRVERETPGGAARGISDSALLATALGLSCLGDVLLHLGFRRYFGAGLGAFFLAHVAYTTLFVRSWPRPLRPGRRQIVLVAAVLVYGVVVTGWLSSHLGGYAVPVIAYALAITGMTVSAILARFSTPLVWIGAMLFVLSDSLIAAGRFRAAVPLAAYLIWPTYYLAQYGIAVGFL